MKTHDLKTSPVYWDAVFIGEKNFEVRRDDRGFQKGDILRLWRSTDPYGWRAPSVSNLERRVTWILTGGQLGIEPGYVVLGLEEPRP